MMGENEAGGLTRPCVKICGLSDAAMIDLAIARGADEVGFVHFPRSPRHVAIEAMAGLRRHVGPRAAVTVVTVDPDDDLLRRLMDEVRPDTIQLHGAESPARVAAIGASTGAATMKAIGVGSRADLDAAQAYRTVADRILLDARAPKGSALPGGNGIAFDWSLLRASGLDGTFVLSGGLDPENVAAAIRIARPSGIDVSSGVESAPGVKSADLLHCFFDALDAASPPSDELRAR